MSREASKSSRTRLPTGAIRLSRAWLPRNHNPCLAKTCLLTITSKITLLFFLPPFLIYLPLKFRLLQEPSNPRVVVQV
jgi:hypothetical protein